MPGMSDLEQSIRKHLRFNLAVNLADGAFFGLGWGFGSIGTILPLFVSRMTNSALLIGLIPAIHAVGWQFPQLFMANSVSRLRRYKPMVMLMTIHERVPYLGLALVALFLGTLGNKLALVLTFAMLIWQGVGAGFTANAWQSMIAKIIPSDWRGTFFGAQAALANILMSIAAIGAGFILDRMHAPLNFTLCFLLTAVGMGSFYICSGPDSRAGGYTKRPSRSTNLRHGKAGSKSCAVTGISRLIWSSACFPNLPPWASPFTSCTVCAVSV